MHRPLSVGGVGLLVLVLTAGLAFGNTQPQPAPLKTPARQASPASFVSANGGKKFVNKKKAGKTKPGKKTGKKKKNKHKKHHKKHHHKKHHKHHKGDKDDQGGAEGGADDGGGDESGGDMGGGDAGGGGDGPDGPAVEPALQAGKGLLITDLDADGPAAVAGLDVDDTILSVNGVRVQSVEGLRAVVEKATGPVTVVFLSDDTGDVEEADVTPRKGRLGITMDVVAVDDGGA
jgi:membrane-associated protease RseP (regulator of RpoE activity)